MALLRATGTVAAMAGLRCVAALPGDAELRDQIDAFTAEGADALGKCSSTSCQKPVKAYERIVNGQPGMQWGDAGGYCGSWSIQRAAMAKGAWISQQQVRDHTVPGGGHDEEILATNIDLALDNLKLRVEGFDYKHLPIPQADSYRKWMKQQLAAGNPLVMMIMLDGGHYPVYPSLPLGLYSHIEPFMGILSDHPLSDGDFYDDDYVVHYTDADKNAYYRSMASLPGDYDSQAECLPAGGKADPAYYRGYACIHKSYGFGWAIKGFQDDRQGLELSLTVDPWEQEPDTRSGAAPEQLTGTVTIDGLTAGAKYALYRWDSVASAFDYSNATTVHRFAAAGAKTVYTDPTTFSSGGSTYYRCVADSGDAVV